jgi:hypothetical protein
MSDDVEVTVTPLSEAEFAKWVEEQHRATLVAEFAALDPATQEGICRSCSIWNKRCEEGTPLSDADFAAFLSRDEDEMLAQLVEEHFFEGVEADLDTVSDHMVKDFASLPLEEMESLLRDEVLNPGYSQ